MIVPNLTEAEFLTERYRGAEALDRHQAREVVDALLAKGYCFVTVEQLLQAKGIQPQDGTVYRCAK